MAEVKKCDCKFLINDTSNIEELINNLKKDKWRKAEKEELDKIKRAKREELTKTFSILCSVVTIISAAGVIYTHWMSLYLWLQNLV